VAWLIAIGCIAGYAWIWSSGSDMDLGARVVTEILFGLVWTLFVFMVVGFVAAVAGWGWYLFRGLRR
jgi:hypothetical protein